VFVASPAFAVDLNKTPASTHSAAQNVIATVPHFWPPQYSTNENGKPTGFAIDVFEEIAARSGLTVTYVIKDSFPKALDALRNSNADVIPNLGILPKRQWEFNFTVPVETFVVSIFVRQGTDDLKGVDDLAGRRLAVVKNNIGLYLFGKRKDTDVKVYKNVRTALFDLVSGVVDAFVYSQPVILKIAGETGVANQIKIVGEPLKIIQRGIAVRKDKPELFAALDKAARSFVGTAAYHGIYAKWYSNPIGFWTVKRLAVATGGGLVLILLVMAAWRYYSVRRLNLALQQNEDEFKDFAEAASDWFWVMDENLCFKNITGHKQELLGLSLDEVIGKTRWDVLGVNPNKDEHWREHRAILEAHEPFRDFLYNCTVADGRHLITSVSGKPIFNKAGIFSGYRGTATDITDLKKIESERLFQANIIETMMEGVILVQLDNNEIVYTNSK